jgi:hypothetical protein
MATDDDDQNAKLLAALGYLGFFVGLPLGLVPVFMAKDELSLFHGKVSTAVWFGTFVLTSVLSFVVSAIAAATCGIGAILVPVIFLPLGWGLIVGIHGIVLSMNGEMTEPIGGFGLGEMLFSNLKVKIPSSDAPEPASAPAAPPAEDVAPGASADVDAAPSEADPPEEAPDAPEAAAAPENEAAPAPPAPPTPAEQAPPTLPPAPPPPPVPADEAPPAPPPPPVPADEAPPPPPPPPPKDPSSEG